jgi:hypothetical protein
VERPRGVAAEAASAAYFERLAELDRVAAQRSHSDSQSDSDSDSDSDSYSGSQSQSQSQSQSESESKSEVEKRSSCIPSPVTSGVAPNISA